MKAIHNRLVYSLVLVIAIALYAVVILSLDYTFIGNGFSPFKTWSPIQTTYFAIAGFVSLSILILNDLRTRNANLQGLVHVPPIIVLSFLILFSMDSRQVLQYLPYLQVFLFNDFGSLFLFGGLLAVYLTYLISDNSYRTISNQNGYLEFLLHSILVVFIGPLLLGTAFFFGISICLSLGLEIFPFYGEGIIGSVLVVSVLLAMYATARILSYLEHNELPNLDSITLGQVLRVIFEIIVVYVCTVAGFSIVGGLVTDSIPMTEIVPFSLISLGLYSVIPFSILLTRFRIFPILSSNSPRKTVSKC
ncbi:MAG: hypothetical protein ACFFE6_15365 [Candidatus Thorarchaeota archaeon]